MAFERVFAALQVTGTMPTVRHGHGAPGGGAEGSRHMRSRRHLLVLLLCLPMRAAADLPPSDDCFAGAGLGNFTRGLSPYTQAGLSWGLHITFNNTPWAGAEINYQGLRSALQSTPLPNGANPENTLLVNDIFTIDFKGTLPMALGPGIIEPYLLGGAGYSWMWSPVLLGSSGSTIDSAGAFPVGGGVSYIFRNGLALDSRFTYNFLTGSRTGLIANGDSWTATVLLGVRLINTPL